jgi:hypothetical protein
VQSIRDGADSKQKNDAGERRRVKGASEAGVKKLNDKGQEGRKERRVTVR